MFDPDNDSMATLVRDFGGNSWMAAELLDQYRRNPRSVTESWRTYFHGLPAGGRDALEKQARLLQLIRAYRVRGHLVAGVDPLGEPRPVPWELDPAGYGLTGEDVGREFFTNDLAGGGRQTLGQILEVLRDTYCRTVGAEYMFIQEFDQREWLQERMEACRNRPVLEPGERLRILDKLVQAEAFERYLHTTYVGHKRFSLEGGEALIPLLDRILTGAAQSGVREALLGMPHRGRLNVLANTVGKPLPRIFAEFEGDLDPEAPHGSGDVKYHLGAAGIHRAPGRALLHLLHRRGAHGPGPGPARERRRPRCGGARGGPGPGVPPALPARRGDRPGVLPALGPQRRRRAQLHPAAHVRQDPRPHPGGAALRRGPGPGRGAVGSGAGNPLGR
jgi:2-oxoglutarate dehydrogenase complex dehydrogenase (E1) component-like enzyme